MRRLAMLSQGWMDGWGSVTLIGLGWNGMSSFDEDVLDGCWIGLVLYTYVRVPYPRYQGRAY